MLKSKSMRLKWVAAVAGVSVGFATLAVRAADPPNQNRNDGALALPALRLPDGFTQTDLTDASGIKTGLVKLTERAVTKGDFNSLLAELALQDRERAREFKNPDQAKLDNEIDRIQAAWKSKYNEEFSINDKNLIFDDSYQIIQGKVSDPNTAINNWPVNAGQPQAVGAADRNPTGGDVQRQITDAKLTKGRDVAVVRFPAVAGTREMTVSMIFHYPLFWRLDVPNDRTGEVIYNDLLGHLKYLADHSAQWPDDKLVAYRVVAHHAAAALYGLEAPQVLGMNQ
jgi:hypothetical protein